MNDSDCKQEMTLRDYFAAAALQGFCANERLLALSSEDLADSAYDLADAMIERESDRRHRQCMIQHAKDIEPK